MNFTVYDWIEAVEREQGCRPSDETIQFIKSVDKIGRVNEAEGRDAAAAGSAAHSEAYFSEMATRIFPKEPEFATLFADLMQFYYMAGYNG